MTSSQRLLHLLLLLVTVASAADTTTTTIHAKIESCSGCSLNKLPNLKSFLKDGEAESYRNVEVTFVPGRKAVMTLYESVDDHDAEQSSSDGGSDGNGAEEVKDVWEDGMKELEKIVLSDYKTKEEMHALMVEKGFQLKSPQEIETMKLQKQKEVAQEEEKKAQRKEENRIRREESRRKKEEMKEQMEEKEREWKRMKEGVDVAVDDYERGKEEEGGMGKEEL